LNIRCSATDELLQMFRVPGSLHRDLGEGAVNVAEIIGRQFDASRSDVLVQPVRLRGPGDRHDPRLLRQQPGNRDLSRRRLFPGCDFPELIDQGLVCLPSLRREAGNDVAEIGAVERRVLVDGAREEALAQRAVGNEADSEFLEGRKYLLLGLPPPQRIFALDRGDRLDCMSTTDCLYARLGKSEVFHLAFPDEVLHRAGDVFDRNVRVHTVLIEEIDGIDLEPLERGLGNLLDVLRPTIQTPLLPRIRIEIEAELGCDHDLSADRSQGFAYELFIRERTVDFSGVEECDSTFDGGPNEGDHLSLVRSRTVAKAHAHAAKSDGRDFQFAVSKSALLHRFSFYLPSAGDQTVWFITHLPGHPTSGSRSRSLSSVIG